MVFRKNLRLLSFDACDRGSISQLETMRDVMHYIKTTRFPNEPEKLILPSDYFDLIAGCGLGGLISIFLGKLRMSIDEAISELSEILNISSNINASPEDQTSHLRKYLEGLLRNRGHPIDWKLETDEETECGTFIVANWNTSLLEISSLRSYGVESHPTSQVTVVDAALATCLQTSPMNPVRHVIWEAFICYGEDTSIACLLSIGSGKHSPVSLSHPTDQPIASSFISEVERMSKQIQKQLDTTTTYYRLPFHCSPDGENVDLIGDIRIKGLVKALMAKEGEIMLEELICRMREPYRVLPTLSPSYIPRESLEDQLSAAILEEGPGRRVIVVTGQPGSGKSELVKHFVSGLRPDDLTGFKHVFWINGSSETTIRSDIVRQTREVALVDEPQTYDDAKKYLKTTQGWLLIYNNANDATLNTSLFFPEGDFGTIIITSSNEAFGLLASEPHFHLKLEVMSGNEAMQLLVGPAQQASLPVEKGGMAAALAHKLGFLPIALAQAGHYMHKTGCNSAEYFTLLEQDVLNSREASLISFTCAIGFKRLSEGSQTLLQLLSTLGPNFPLAAIPYAAKKLFRSDAFTLVEQSPQIGAAIQFLEQVFLSDGSQFEERLEEMTSTLHDYCFISLKPTLETSLVSVHPLVRTWALSSIPDEKREILRDAAGCLLACNSGSSFLKQYFLGHVDALMRICNPGTLDLNQRAVFGKLLRESAMNEDARAIWQDIYVSLKEKYGATGVHVATAAIELAATYDDDTLSQMEQFETEATLIRETLLGPHHPDTLHAKQELAGTFYRQKRYEENVELRDYVLQVLLSQHSAGHPDVMERISSLALACVLKEAHDHSANRHDERTIDILLELLEHQKDYYGRAHRKVHMTMELLSSAYSIRDMHSAEEEVQIELWDLLQRGRSKADTHMCTMKIGESLDAQRKYSRAEPLFKQASEGLKIELGELHNQTSKARLSLTKIYCHWNSFKEAQSQLTELWEARKPVFGESDPLNIECMVQLGSVYFKQSKHSDAERLLIQALEIQKGCLQDEETFWRKIRTMMELADVYAAQRRYDDEANIEVQMLNELETRLGSANMATLASMSSLATTYTNQGRLIEAEKLRIKEIEGRRASHNPPDQLMFMALNELAAIYLSQGRTSEAEPPLLKVVEEERDVTSQGAMAAMHNLATIYRSQKRFDEANKILETAFDRNKARLAKVMPEIVIAMRELARDYEHVGRYSKATPIWIKIVQIKREKTGNMSLDTMSSMCRLGSSYIRQGNDAEAIPVYVEALKGLKVYADAGKDHGLTATVTKSLSRAYFRQGQYQESLPLQLQVLAQSKKSLGSETVEVARISRDVASVFYKLKRMEEAEKFAMEAAAVFLRLSGVASEDYQHAIGLIEMIRQPTLSSTLKWIKGLF
ncbi:hypothetical protein M408DRAFT_144526 [Serendipita vermifera MAFF 305830]|uniref:NB-ARC domain-containing protein n=1 Tax=Serendipita vermifera MAFF 305830 TaxID=933852 RepID=A0A0C2XGG3_SERVB|nr:hypothetical protein M408DRAFT_144526 [Serendipita vermifera MAFF 305830]